MKKLMIITAVFFTLSVSAANENPIVNEEVLKTFHMVFTDAKNVQWKTNEDRNEVSFFANNIRVRAIIDNKGRLLSTYRYYKENILPARVRYELKKQYKNETIYGVTEVTKNDEVVYFVTLMNAKQIINTAVDAGGQVLEAKKYNRGDI